MIKKIVYNDAYRPHTFEEISALLAPEVAATLDPDKEYGLQAGGAGEHPPDGRG